MCCVSIDRSTIEAREEIEARERLNTNSYTSTHMHVNCIGMHINCIVRVGAAADISRPHMRTFMCRAHRICICCAAEV